LNHKVQNSVNRPPFQHKLEANLNKKDHEQKEIEIVKGFRKEKIRRKRTQEKKN
jgi:hypothetical protein